MEFIIMMECFYLRSGWMEWCVTGARALGWQLVVCLFSHSTSCCCMPVNRSQSRQPRFTRASSSPWVCASVIWLESALSLIFFFFVSYTVELSASSPCFFLLRFSLAIIAHSTMTSGRTGQWCLSLRKQHWTSVKRWGRSLYSMLVFVKTCM